MNKTIIVTGAAGNLGKSVTQQLLDEGFKVEATLGPKDDPNFLVHENLRSKSVNLFDELISREFVEDIHEASGQLYGAVLLVGGFAEGDISSTNAALLEKMYRLNFETAYFIVRPLLEALKAQQKGGHIVFVGSRPALEPNEGKHLVAYSLSKVLLIQLAKYINADFSTHQVSASVIVPSTLDTPGTRIAMPEADFSRWVPTDKLAEVVSFILSNTGSMLRDPILKLYNRS